MIEVNFLEGTVREYGTGTRELARSNGDANLKSSPAMIFRPRVPEPL